MQKKQSKGNETKSQSRKARGTSVKDLTLSSEESSKVKGAQGRNLTANSTWRG